MVLSKPQDHQGVPQSRARPSPLTHGNRLPTAWPCQDRGQADHATAPPGTH